MADRRHVFVADQQILPRTAPARRRRWWALALAVLVGGVAATLLVPPVPRLVWNASASAPIGLYVVHPRTPARAGEMALARVPARWRMLAAMRRYVPADVPLIKRVAAASGDSVCALGREVYINGRWITERRVSDGKGRVMPWWSGCAILRDGSLFLLMDNPASFDGRYFGPTAPADVIGRANALWGH